MKKRFKTKRKIDYPLITNIKQEKWRKSKIDKRTEDKTIFKKYNLKFKLVYFLIIIIIIQFILNISFYFSKNKSQPYKTNFNNYNNNYNNHYNNNIYSEEKIEEIETNILLPIQNKLGRFIEIIPEEQKFLNGIVRKFRPKKMVEIGVSAGGTAALMLNAIKDLPNSKLYSIDRRFYNYRNKKKKSGWLVQEQFPELMDKWTLYIGKNTAEVIESIGDNIDFAFIDTVHVTPGEMLNWLEVLPFLKEEAIVVFHDTFLTFGNLREPIKNFSNNQLLCFIRGKLILPSYGNQVFSRNIGAIKLEKNQKNYYKNYFMALGSQWQYFPNETDLSILREHYKKYYGEKMVEIYDDAVQKNKKRFDKL